MLYSYCFTRFFEICFRQHLTPKSYKHMLMSSLMYCSWLLRAFTVINLHWTILWLLFGHSLLHVFQSLYCGHWLFRQVLKFSSLGFVLLVLLIDSSFYWRDVPGYSLHLPAVKLELIMKYQMKRTIRMTAIQGTVTLTLSENTMPYVVM